ncbi:hypothetical protein [Parvularcula lutaonensis]|uniref:Uncharacterized protein n=1 Tax=Parvularcula lutaonensis TaxID=491923 RepID=A0ABV7MG27_9PROT|nr:hypothetical protein [Parvularcula lutaonensis]GGY55631.1 hypothetical protein GCM10007148_26910 [Parvularcula lutaonensis]
MVGRREAQGTVDKFQRLACYEAVKRNRIVTPEDVTRWCALPMSDVLRHLGSLKNEGKIVEKNGVFSTKEQRQAG